MPYPREVLNELKWREGLTLDDALVTYRHRGAPGDERTISGREIEELQHSFFRAGGSVIPYHRILRIEHRGEIVYEAKEK